MSGFLQLAGVALLVAGGGLILFAGMSRERLRQIGSVGTALGLLGLIGWTLTRGQKPVEVEVGEGPESAVSAVEQEPHPPAALGFTFGIGVDSVRAMLGEERGLSVLQEVRPGVAGYSFAGARAMPSVSPPPARTETYLFFGDKRLFESTLLLEYDREAAADSAYAGLVALLDAKYGAGGGMFGSSWHSQKEGVLISVRRENGSPGEYNVLLRYHNYSLAQGGI